MTSLPFELYDEIISYLWDDKNALRACSCAGRILTVASQKLLFYQIILCRDCDDSDRSDDTNFGGTTSTLHKLLGGSPHIADYVQCLQIFDIDDSYPYSSDDDDSSENEPLEDAWLANDTFLPLFAPLLCNLKAFVLLYVPDWDLLCEAVRRSLQDLIRLPSLVYVDIAPRPTIVFKESFSNNLKHLVIHLDHWTQETSALIQPSSCSEPPIHLETLCISKAEPEFLTRLTSDPNFRFKTSYLRRLLLDIRTDKTFYHFALEPLLQSCRETLEDFTFMPCIDFLSTNDISPGFTPIDLSRLMALKTFNLLLDIPNFRFFNSWDPIWCFNNLLRSVSSTCQRLEDFTVALELYGQKFEDTCHWNEICGILLNPSRFPRLRKLTIYALDSANDVASVFLASLENSESFASLRARPGIEVVTSVKDHIDWVSAPDKRWENAILPR